MAQFQHDYAKTQNRFIYNLKSRLRHANPFKSTQRRIKVDMYIKEYETYNMHLEGRKTVGIYRVDYWTDESSKSLQEDGYLRCDGLYDSLIFWGVPVYLRVHGLTKFDITQKDPETGKLLYSQDTAATLHDMMTSSATADFIKGMAKTTLPAMDTQKLMMIGIIAVGAVFGMWVLGIF